MAIIGYLLWWQKENSMLLTAGYGQGNFGQWSKPEASVTFHPVPDVDYPYASAIGKWGFILSDNTKVRIRQSRLKPDLVGKEGTWGSFREELQCSNEDLNNEKQLERLVVAIDVLDPNPLWLVVDYLGRSTNPLDPIVRIAVELERRGENINYWKQQNENLHSIISRRNRLIEDLRKKNRKTEKRLVTLSKN